MVTEVTRKGPQLPHLSITKLSPKTFSNYVFIILYPLIDYNAKKLFNACWLVSTFFYCWHFSATEDSHISIWPITTLRSRIRSWTEAWHSKICLLTSNWPDQNERLILFMESLVKPDTLTKVVESNHKYIGLIIWTFLPNVIVLKVKHKIPKWICENYHDIKYSTWHWRNYGVTIS